VSEVPASTPTMTATIQQHPLSTPDSNQASAVSATSAGALESGSLGEGDKAKAASSDSSDEEEEEPIGSPNPQVSSQGNSVMKAASHSADEVEPFGHIHAQNSGEGNSVMPASHSSDEDEPFGGIDPQVPGEGNSVMKAASHASSDNEEPYGSPDPQVEGEGTFQEGSSRARRVDHRVWSCAGCGTSVEVKDKLRQCSGCKRVLYCGKACQNADWPAHKSACRRLQAMLE
jgi:hypothetical protein